MTSGLNSGERSGLIAAAVSDRQRGGEEGGVAMGRGGTGGWESTHILCAW